MGKYTHTNGDAKNFYPNLLHTIRILMIKYKNLWEEVLTTF